MADDAQPPILIAVVADMHINSTVGLCPPVVTLDDGGSYHASRAQLVVWSAWKEFWKDCVWKPAKKLKAKVWAVFNGDLNDLNVHDGAGLISGAESDIERATLQVIEPIADKADRLFFNRGTEAHTGKKAHLEEEIAANFDNTAWDEQGKDAKRATWDWLKLMAHDSLLDIAHHPCTSSRRMHTRDAAAERQAAETVMQYVHRHERVPDFVIRSHVHYFARGGELAQGIFTPPWKLCDAFGHRIGASGAIEPVGGLVFVCRKGGKCDWDVHRWWPKRKPVWTGS